jgi:hypothetical protein
LATAERDRCQTRLITSVDRNDVDRRLGRAVAAGRLLDAYSSSEDLVAALPFER